MFKNRAQSTRKMREVVAKKILATAINTHIAHQHYQILPYLHSSKQFYYHRSHYYNHTIITIIIKFILIITITIIHHHLQGLPVLDTHTYKLQYA